MQKSDKQQIFQQFRLSNAANLRITTVSTFEKVRALTQGCILRKSKELYKSLKTFTEDLQIIYELDPQSANIVFNEYPQIKFYYNEKQQQKNIIKVQCRKCGQYTNPFKFCSKCENVHYCSEVCEINVKLTHEKDQCRIINYPKIQQAITIQVHFGTDLGNNVQIYFQHFCRAYALMRGKQIIKSMDDYFKKIARSDKELRLNNRRGFLEERLMKYTIQGKQDQKRLVFNYKNDKEYATGELKIDVQDIETLKRIYEQNLILEQAELYLYKQGGILVNCSQEIHNNHIHWVYIFKVC